MKKRSSRMAFVAPGSRFRAPSKALVKSGAHAGTRIKKVRKIDKSRMSDNAKKLLFGIAATQVASRAGRKLAGRLKGELSSARPWRAAVHYGDRSAESKVTAYQTNTIRRTQEDSQNYYTKNIFGANGIKLRQLQRLYGSKKVIINNSKELGYIEGIPSYTAPTSPTAAKSQLTNIDFGFNQKLWLFPVRANIDTALFKSYFGGLLTEGETTLTRAYGHILSTESRIEIATSNAFLPTRVTVHTCSFKDNFLDYTKMFKSVIPEDFDNVGGIGGPNLHQSALPQKYLLEPRVSNNAVNNTLLREYGALSALVDPKTRFSYSRWFSRHVNIVKSDSRVLGPGDVWTYTNVHNFRNPINLSNVQAVAEDSANPFDTFFIVECVGVKTTLYNKTYLDQDDLVPFIGTSPGQINLELQTAIKGVLRPTPMIGPSDDPNNPLNDLYEGVFSSQVIQMVDKGSARINNLSRDKIGTRSEVFDPTNNIQAFIPVATDEQTAYARVITATPEPTLTDEVP